MIKYSTHVTRWQSNTRPQEERTGPALHSNITMIFVVTLCAILISNVGTAEKICVINFNAKQSNGTESLHHSIDGTNVTATREATFCFKFMLRYSRGMLLIKTNQVHFTIMDQVWPLLKCLCLFAFPKNLGGQVKSMTFSMGGHGSLLLLLVTR